MQKIILASGSANRKMLMDALNIPYEIIPANIDEKAIRDENLALRAEKIARAKAESVAQKHKGIIIAADSFAVHNGKVYERPKTIEEAKQMLKEESGNDNSLFYAGVCYLDKENNINYSTSIVVKFSTRKFSNDEINEIVNKYPVLTWAGAFSPSNIDGLTTISKMNGSLTGMTHGLPMEIIIPLLEKSGVKISP
jgi:septum formation protein